MRVLTDEEEQELKYRQETLLNGLYEGPFLLLSSRDPSEAIRDAFEKMNASHLRPVGTPLLLTVEQTIALQQDCLGRELTDGEKLEIVNRARQQWGFPVIEKLPPEEG